MVGPGQKQTLNQVVSTFDNNVFFLFIPRVLTDDLYLFFYSDVGIQLQVLEIKTFNVSLQLFSFFLFNLMRVIVSFALMKDNFHTGG